MDDAADRGISPELAEAVRARHAAGTSCCDVAAVVAGKATLPDQDGESWRIIVFDGATLDTLVGFIPQSARSGDLDDEELVLLVERRASNLPAQGRLLELAARSPVQLMYSA